MHAVWGMVAAAVLGVDVGWQPAKDETGMETGGLEYIIQIEPDLIQSLESGSEIVSEIPPRLLGVKQYRIKLGTGPVPREGDPPPRETSPVEPVSQDPPAEAASPGGLGERYQGLPPFERQPFEEPPVEQEGDMGDGPRFDAQQPQSLPQEPIPTEPTEGQSVEQNTQPATFAKLPAEPKSLEATLGHTEKPVLPNEPSESGSEDHPWLLTLLALFGSAGANVWLFWNTWGTRRKYIRLLHDVNAGGAAMA